MTQTITFDTLAYAKKLKAAGVPENQAEIQAEALSEIIEERVATKLDIHEPRRDIREMEERLKNELTLRFGKMLAWSTGIIIAVVAALVKLL